MPAAPTEQEATAIPALPVAVVQEAPEEESWGVSSEDVQLGWRYKAAEQLCLPSEDGSTPWAPGHPRHWGTDDRTIPLPPSTKSYESHSCDLNADGSKLAYTLGSVVLIYNLNGSDPEPERLEGHEGEVGAVQFHPADPTKLVSAASAWDHKDGAKTKSEIIFWDLSSQRKARISPEDLSAVARAGTVAVAELLAGKSWQPDAEDQAAITATVLKRLEELNVRSLASSNLRIAGRLPTSFGARLWDAAGDRLIFLPGEAPGYNRLADWKVCVYNLRSQETIALNGHTDAIMWAGFSPNGELVATVAWDKTFAIWDAATGEKKHLFRSKQQNWAGAFSPDSTRFAGTTGDGLLYVWSTADGSVLLEKKLENDWNRHLAWSPEGTQLLVESDCLGKVEIVDAATGTVIQRRKLDRDGLPVAIRRHADNFLAVIGVRWLEGGEVLYLTSIDNSIEVYDQKTNMLMRFAPPDEQKKGRVVDAFPLPQHRQWVIVDTNAIRIWSV